MTMQIVEIVAAVFGLVCVILTIRQNIWCWPAGLVQVTLYILVFYEARLYSDMLLHVIYVAMQFFGWWNWLYGGENRTRLAVVRLAPAAGVFWSGLAVVGTLALGWSMSRYTNADLPYWDAAITVLSLIAQWLMAKKTLESYLIWILVDVLAVGVYAVKALYPSTLLYACFLCLATAGFLEWRKDLPKPAMA